MIHINSAFAEGELVEQKPEKYAGRYTLPSSILGAYSSIFFPCLSPIRRRRGPVSFREAEARAVYDSEAAYRIY